MPAAEAQPSFSIVVPTHQRRELVCEVVRALGELEYAGHVELIVVVDGSSDGTAEALRELASPWVLHVIEQPNRGAAAARNRGAAAARREILLFLDDDMIAAPDLLAQHAVRYAEGVHAVLGHMPLDPGSPPGFLSEGVGRWAEARLARLAGGGALELHDLLTGQLSVRRAVFEALGGFDEHFTRGGSFGNEDLDFGVRLLARHNVVFAPAAISRQRYVVTPELLLRRSREAGHADARLARKHPARAAEIFAANEARRRSVRVLARALARAPAAVRGLSALALRAAHRGTRTAQRLFHLARQVEYHAGSREAQECRLRVLCYHAVSDLSDDAVLGDYGVEPAMLARQLDDLRAAGCQFVSADEVLAWFDSGEPLPPRAVLLTFDDCYRDLLDAARTVLAPRQIPALAFAVSGLVGRENAWDQAVGARALPLLDADELLALAREGVEIGAHSRSHRQLAGLGDEELQGETAGAADDLAGLGLPRPRFFAYPYGVHDARARAAVRRGGYAAGFALGAKRVRRTSPLALPRTEVLASDGVEGLRRKLRMAR